ncbi:MAG: NADPH-dependent FMN reductase [Methanobacteriota archaeon]|nr:MAG: NADPH-dependent FMN reductase [Euryarchaeota archaeon]|tara:strand:+ start:2160 stop:2705 length:546 start_codon:yes stop_codon:yes gene_type:complete
MSAIKVLGISGSYGLNSNNSKLVKLGLDILKELGAETIFWDLNEKPLPLVGEEGSWENKNVNEFQNLATEVNSYLLSSPEYHGCMSGVMKNQLDWIYSKHVSGKPFGLMSTLGGQSNSNTLNQMRIAVRWIHGWAIPEQIAVPSIKDAFNEDGLLKNELLMERLENMMESLFQTTLLFKNK